MPVASVHSMPLSACNTILLRFIFDICFSGNPLIKIPSDAPLQTNIINIKIFKRRRAFFTGLHSNCGMPSPISGKANNTYQTK